MDVGLKYASLGVLVACQLFMPVREAFAETKQIVLGGNSQVLKQPVKPGAFNLRLVNVMNGTNYIIESHTTAVNALSEMPEPLKLPPLVAAQSPCEKAISDFTAAVEKAATEEEVAKARDAALKEATDADCKKKINDTAVLDVAGEPFEVGVQEDITFSIKRPKQGKLGERDFGNYTFATARKQPGIWTALYGFNYIKSGDEKYYSKASEGTPVTYTVTESTDRSERDFVPSIYFMWLKEHNHGGWVDALSWNNEDVFGGITTGIGFDFDNPTAFLGYGVGWGYNVLLTVGTAMHKEKRLNGRYHSGDVINENLSEDQLTDETYKSRAYVGIAFRFGENPFKKKATSTATSP